MSRSHNRLTSVTLGLLIGLLFVIGSGYLFLGGADRFHGVEERVPSSATPHFGTPASVLPANNGGGKAPTAQGIRRILGDELSTPAVGHLSAAIVDAATGKTVFSQDPSVPLLPASINKMATTVSALAALGPGHRIDTRVVAGSSADEVVLIGGGDVTLSKDGHGFYAHAARLDELAKQVQRSHPGTITHVVLDSSLFSGANTASGWDDDIISAGYSAPITPLEVDGGRTSFGSRESNDAPRSSQPDLDAAHTFASMLGSRVTVTRGVASRRSEELGKVQSAPLSTVVEQALRISDNTLAEAIGHQLAIKLGQSGSFKGAATAVRTELGRLGIDVNGVVLADSSGLSRDNRLTAKVLTAVLAVAASAHHPELRSLITGLPVAGYSGTLADRFKEPTAEHAAGYVRAKTGSLSGVSSLAGVLTTSDGRELSFALLANDYPGGDGGLDAVHAALDTIAATLARCGC